MPSIPHKLRCLALGALTLAAALSSGDPAQAQGSKGLAKRDPRAEKKACVEAHAKGQALVKDGKLTAAREEFITCGRETCPGAIRKECAALLTEVEANQPSIVIEARDEIGRPTTDVKVFVDDTEIAASLDGRALEIDPGQHSIRYVSKRGKTIEQSVVILEGQRNRKLSAIFGHPPPPPPPPPKPFQIPVLAYVAGGVGALGLGSFVVWGLLGNSKQGELEDTCAPRCSQEDADTMRRDFLIADLSLGLAAVALGAAVVITVIENGDEPSPAPAPPPVGVVLRPGGVAAFGRF